MYHHMPTFRVCLAFRANTFFQEENKITYKEAPLEVSVLLCFTLDGYKP